jgi:hypothetical protein
MEALANFVAAVWITSLLLCLVIFWPIIRIEFERARQRWYAPETESKDALYVPPPPAA